MAKEPSTTNIVRLRPIVESEPPSLELAAQIAINTALISALCTRKGFKKLSVEVLNRLGDQLHQQPHNEAFRLAFNAFCEASR